MSKTLDNSQQSENNLPNDETSKGWVIGDDHEVGAENLIVGEEATKENPE